MTAYDDLMAHQRQTEALAQIAGRLSWDRETVMPRGAAAQRSEEAGALSEVLHARRTDPRIGDWLEAASGEALDQAGEAQLRHIRRSYERTQRVPCDLAARIAKFTALSQGRWAEAREADDFAAFAPVLAEVVALRREEGAALADGGDIYDAMLDDYEPGAKAVDLEAMFGALRPGLIALREAALGAAAAPVVSGQFDVQTQMRLARQLAKVCGYDMTRGRIDKAVHPFSSGSGDDVRITTRTSDDEPFNCIYSTMHEAGHAIYEQSIDPAYALTPLGAGVSMGVHESQSRIVENQLGRSRAFTGWLYGQLRDAFGDFGIDGPDAFYAAANSLHRGYIRTEADEVQYNLHILMRFDLERALVSGDLAPGDLEEAWNARFLRDFGYAVPRASQGCLQDVHWSVGLFGYFPTYSLGNVYAGCLAEALRQAVPTLDDQLADGDMSAAMAWLRENVQQHGGLYTPRELITRACGAEPSEAPLMNYLEQKFGALYPAG
ncbi:carboxypeptidase Taq [Roseovarius nanhaiticus]|uniref:Metal-dependent carboxypeptidase n=1 Tax=Roseovarius nanhaiticus TaxID=573024 RepID=A0A1N7HH50_9RHOB|nr:carboxypeptidase M32 [Roseovarius nanhaiticus]SEK94804.1 carboxypeptidase Taq [Roseovarius nanhaiticus]SIS24132.1 carboxypeptidase Taq [Roseovarius nanhaiticus]